MPHSCQDCRTPHIGIVGWRQSAANWQWRQRRSSRHVAAELASRLKYDRAPGGGDLIDNRRLGVDRARQCLAIPDKRHTFDVARAVSTIGELVEAYLLDYTRPSIRQLFDHCSGERAMGPGECWTKEIDTKQLPPYSGETALLLAYHQAQEIAATGRYFDSHCWVFTSLSFLKLIGQAARLGLLPFVLKGFHPTEAGDFEFFVNFERPDLHEAGLRGRQTDAIQAAMKMTADALRAARLLSA